MQLENFLARNDVGTGFWTWLIFSATFCFATVKQFCGVLCSAAVGLASRKVTTCKDLAQAFPKVFLGGDPA